MRKYADCALRRNYLKGVYVTILVDFNQVVTTWICNEYSTKDFVTDDANKKFLVQHCIVKLSNVMTKFSSEYGEMVVCVDADGKKYWRKDIFPHYKANRKKSKDASVQDWDYINTVMSEIKNILIDVFPFKVVQVSGAEADDCIAILAKHMSDIDDDFFVPSIPSKTLIVSADKDLNQLYKYGNVTQFSPKEKKFFAIKNPDMELKTKIMRGDSGDGIPSYINPSDCFMNGIRQKSLYQKVIDEALTLPNILDICESEEQRDRLKLNKTLIDLSEIPIHISDKIMINYNEQKPNQSKTTLVNYLAKNRMGGLIEVVPNFFK
jgi:hypothetical protein